MARRLLTTLQSQSRPGDDVQRTAHLSDHILQLINHISLSAAIPHNQQCVLYIPTTKVSLVCARGVLWGGWYGVKGRRISSSTLNLCRIYTYLWLRRWLELVAEEQQQSTDKGLLHMYCGGENSNNNSNNNISFNCCCLRSRIYSLCLAGWLASKETIRVKAAATVDPRALLLGGSLPPDPQECRFI